MSTGTLTDTKVCPSPDPGSILPVPSNDERPVQVWPPQQVCVKAMLRPADCSVLNQFTSLLLAQACPSHSLAQTTNQPCLVGPSVLK